MVKSAQQDYRPLVLPCWVQHLQEPILVCTTAVAYSHLAWTVPAAVRQAVVHSMVVVTMAVDYWRRNTERSSFLCCDQQWAILQENEKNTRKRVGEWVSEVSNVLWSSLNVKTREKQKRTEDEPTHHLSHDSDYDLTVVKMIVGESW